MPLKFYNSFEVNERELGELFCAECTRDGNSVDVLNYCLGCESLYCYQCLQDHTSGDEILDLPNEETLKSLRSSENNNRYPRNNNNYSNIGNKADLQTETKNKLLSIKKQLLKCLEHDRMEQEQSLQKIINTVDERICKLRANVNKLLEDLKHDTLKEVNKFHHKMYQFRSDKEKSIDILLEKADVSIACLQKTNAKSVTEELAGFAEQIMKEVVVITEDPDEYYSGKIDKAKQDEINNTNITLEQSINDFLYNVNVLGRDFVRDCSFSGSCKTVSKSYDVRGPTDTKKCDINSSCIMPDGTVLLADWNNSNIKQLDKSYHVTNTCDLPGIPWAICSTTGKEVAVSLHFLQKIQFATTSNERMMLTDSFKVNQKCRGVTWADDKIFIACGGGGLLESRGQIQIYTRNGTLLEVLDTDSSGDLISCPQHITINGDKSRLYLADRNSGLMAVNLQKKMHGEQEERPKLGTNHCEAKGVCLIDDSNILLCDFIQNDIVMYRNTNGYGSAKSVKTILDKTDKINNPQSICFLKKNSNLLVTNGNTDRIQVFKLDFQRNN